MSENLISDANSIYECAEKLSINSMKLDFPNLFGYLKSIRKLQRVLGESIEDEFWKPIISRLKSISFLLTAIPLTQKELNSEVNRVLEQLHSSQQLCKLQYSSIFPKFQETIQYLTCLNNDPLDILRANLEELISKLDGSVGIVIISSKYLPTLNQQFDNKKAEFIVSRQLAKPTILDNIILIGTVGNRWFPDHILSAPRSTNIISLYFECFHWQWKSENVFLESLVGSKSRQVSLQDDNEQIDEESIEPELLLPKFDFSTMISKANKTAEEFGDQDEFVEAIIGHLENDQIVFLDIDDSSEIRVIDVEDEENPIKKVKVKDIVPDMFILLKTSGGGDYIVPVADSIMGVHATELRLIQREWKNRLRILYTKNGCDWLENELKKKGCKIANYMNIRNWMSYRSIKTQRFEDFIAILEVIELEVPPAEVWEKMKLITQAHRKAGHHIQNLLLSKAKTIDFDELVSLGMMELVLPDKDSGSITAFRVKALSEKSESILVSSHRINMPMDVDE